MIGWLISLEDMIGHVPGNEMRDFCHFLNIPSNKLGVYELGASEHVADGTR